MLQSSDFVGPVAVKPLEEAGGPFMCSGVLSSLAPVLQVSAPGPVEPPLGMRLLVVSNWRVT